MVFGHYRSATYFILTIISCLHVLCVSVCEIQRFGGGEPWNVPGTPAYNILHINRFIGNRFSQSDRQMWNIHRTAVDQTQDTVHELN